MTNEDQFVDVAAGIHTAKEKTILLLGQTGKMGIALGKSFAPDCVVIGRNSRDFDASDFGQVRAVVEASSPDVIINTIAFQGLDRCELDPESALRLNTLLPEQLARLAAERNIPLVHFSTDAVFRDKRDGFCTEEDIPAPLNLYGITKYGGDCLVSHRWEKQYIVRIPLLFGESLKADQFVEKMLSLVRSGQRSIRVADDVVSSPTYSRDVAERIRELLTNGAPFGTYHIANEGTASLYELMLEVVSSLQLDVEVVKGSYKDFPHVACKNRHTPLRSVRCRSLRPWREAVHDYCNALQIKGQ